MKTEHPYDPDCAEAAAELWQKLSGHEGEDNDAQLIIERALKDYACEADRRITESEWAQKYKQTCIEISYVDDLMEAAKNLREIVEGVRSVRWAADGRRLKDTPEWCAFYVALAHFKVSPLNK